MSDYVPVACSFHDRLEHLAMRRIPCRIRYLAEGRELFRDGLIRDIMTASGAEYLVLEGDAERIRLDRIVGIEPAPVQLR